jgi:Uncharacterized protein conserved in bacteria (DUF2252)/Amidohydrolase
MELLEEQVAELVPIRYARMSASPFAFFRGAAAVMACDLAATPQTGIRVQLWGDARLANHADVGPRRPRAAVRRRSSEWIVKLAFSDTPLQKIDVYGILARLHYDVAGAPLPHALPGLLAITSAEQLLYASDTPFTPSNAIQAGARALLETDVLDDTQRRALFTDNAKQLFPASPDRRRDRRHPWR